MRIPICALILVAATGCFAANEAPAPDVGTHGSRVVLDESAELVDARGLRPQLEGFHYLSALGSTGDGDFRLLVPSAEPGVYGRSDCASLKLWDGDLYASHPEDAELEVVLERGDDGSVVGEVSALLCSYDEVSGGSALDCLPVHGRFTARLEADNGPAMAAGGCVEASDCAGVRPEGAQGCGHEPVCHDGRCLLQ